MTDTWEHDPHEVADDVDALANGLGNRGRYQDAATLFAAAEMLRALWEQRAADEATAIAQETGQYDGWRTHDSHEPPADLAAAQLVVVCGYFGGDAGGGYIDVLPVNRVSWCPELPYRPALSANGDWLCSGEGLEPWAKWVSTDKNGAVEQYDQKPILSPGVRVWTTCGRNPPGPSCRAPETHRKPGPASESLMEVHRD